MRKRKLPTVTPAVDSDGKAIVYVSLGNSPLKVRMFPEDFDLLKSRGLGGGWYLSKDGRGHTYVLVSSREKDTTVARRLLAINAYGARVRVKYIDGDRLNLRRDNLIVVESTAKATPITTKANPQQ
jgi:hypothetical protein